ncbi:MAG: cell division protein [Bacteroidaceae bacterium]
MKTLLKLILLLAMIVYLVMAITKFNKPDRKQICQGVEFIVSDSAKAAFITTSELARVLKKNELYPVGKRLDFVDSRKMEKILETNPFIESAQCYKTAGNIVRVSVSQRLPVLRIMAENGENYYIDKHGFKMEGVPYAADLVVVTGHVTFAYVKKNLVPLGRFLQDNSFWDSQIEQLNVTENGEIEMVPRVGDHLVFLGKPIGLSHKFSHLEAFYKKVMREVGWNKYSFLNLEFDNQIICTKKI